jgi:hypothetical protein
MTTMSARSAAAEAAQALLGAAQGLAPSVPASEIHRAVHTAAQTLRGAFGAGASMDAVLAHLITATAPPAPLPPFEPWAPILSMSFDEFAESGVGLHVRLPALGEAVWLVSDERTQARVVKEWGVWDRFAKLPSWMRVEADQLKLPDDPLTVGRFVETIEGRVIGWRGPEA